MRAQDYIFANVSGIDIIGEVLPQHEAEGGWRPERGEDWAFLAEAYGERSLIAYKDSAPPRTQAEIEAKIAQIRNEDEVKYIKVTERSRTAALLENVRFMLHPEKRMWCAQAPQERTLEHVHWADDWEDICPDIFPQRQLGPEATDWEPRWEVARLRAAFADLAANQCYMCRNWFDAARQTSVQEFDDGRQVTWPTFTAYVSLQGGTGRWEIAYPNTPTLTLPDRAGTPALLALFHAYTSQGRYDRYHLKVLQPGGITKQLLMGMAETPQQDDYAHVTLVKHVMAVPINLRTTLN